jgi:tRNA pseudouridine55 synthase
LDPFATGVLPLTLGKATKLTHYFQSSDKVYCGVMRFGFATNTYDVDGTPLGDDAKPQLDPIRLEEIFARYQGSLCQTLPPYSAKKVQGKPLYAYARKGIDIGPTTKEVVIHSLKLLGVNQYEVEFELSCAAGTYARSLAHDIGAEYGCGAHLVRLRRTRSGDFSIEKALLLSDGQTYYPQEFFLSHMIPLRDLLSEIPAITISDGDKQKLNRGMDLNILTTDWEAEQYRILDISGDLVAMVQKIQSFEPQVPQPARWIRVHPSLVISGQ